MLPPASEKIENTHGQDDQRGRKADCSSLKTGEDVIVPVEQSPDLSRILSVSRHLGQSMHAQLTRNDQYR